MHGYVHSVTCRTRTIKMMDLRTIFFVLKKNYSTLLATGAVELQGDVETTSSTS